MADITITRDSDRNLTVFTIQGMVLPAEVIEAIEQAYGQEATGDSLWDFSQAFWGPFENDQLIEVAGTAQRFAGNRGPARTVIVAADRMESLIVKLYTLITERLNSPISYHITTSRSDAYAWLDTTGETPE